MCGENMMLYANLITKQSGKRKPIGYANRVKFQNGTKIITKCIF